MSSGAGEAEDAEGARVRDAMRLIVEGTLEGETDDALVRSHHESGSEPGLGGMLAQASAPAL